jgi:2-methylfumaryl-CoA isomerase
MLNLRVIESSAFIAAPLAGLTLAQFGSDVIRVDMIGGGIDYGRLPLMPSGRSLYWTGLNRGKRSLAVDLRRPEGRELIRNLVTAPGENGGILLTNIVTPWLSHASLSGRSDVISCMIEGNPDGSTAVDYTVNCATGYPAMTGSGSMDAPINHALPAWDIACAFQAAFSIVAAAERRRRTGQGAALRLALADVAFTMLAHLGLTAEAELLKRDRPSLGNYIYGSFGRDFGTADGERVMVAGISSGQWAALVKACGMEQKLRDVQTSLALDFGREADRFQAREAIAGTLEPWFAARTLAQVREVLDRHNVCWGQYRTTRSLLAEDTRVGSGNSAWAQIDTPGVGRHWSAGTPVRVSDEQRPALGPAPVLGQHTDEILLDVLGLDTAAVGRLHDTGVVAGPERDPTMRYSS